MGELFDEIADENAESGPPRCRVALVLRELRNGDRADLITAIADPSMHSTRIARVLTKRGHRISDSSIARHRRGACQCEGQEDA